MLAIAMLYLNRSLLRFCSSAIAVLTNAIVWAQLDAPELQVRVTLEQAAASAPRVVEALAKQSKLKLIAAPALGKDVILLRVEAMPLAQVMKRIAEVTHAEWNHSTSGYRLERSAATEKKLQSEERQRGADATRRELQTQLKQLDGLAFNAPSRSAEHLGQIAALLRPTLRLTQALDLNLLASMEEQQRLVFSSDPMPMQKPLGKNYQDVLHLMADEFNRNRPLTYGRMTADALEAAFEKSVRPGDDLQPRSEIRSKKALLALDKVSPNGFKVSLKLYNATGQQIFAVFTNLKSGMLSDAVPSSGIAQLLSGSNTELLPSPESVALARVFLPGVNGAKQSRLPAAIDAKFRRPDLFDPFSFQVSDYLLQVARHKNVPLVANLPDEMSPIHAIYSHQNEPQTVNEYLASLAKASYLNVDVIEGWLQVKPSRPYEAWRLRVDRPSLAKLLQSAGNSGSAGLDALADYAQANPSKFSATIDEPYFLLYCPNAMAMGDTPLDWNLVRYYATLNPQQRTGVRAGAEIPFSSMTANQRNSVSRIVFGTGATLEVSEENPQGGTETANPASETWQQEPTELMPNGLPPVGTLLTRSLETPIGVFAGEDIGNSMYGGMAARGFATIREEMESEDPRWASAFMVRLGQRSQVECVFQLAPDVRLRKTLTDDAFDVRQKPLAWAELPERFRADVEAEMARLKKVRAELAQRKQNVKPPPP